MSRREGPTRAEIDRIATGHLVVHKTKKESSGPHAICDCPKCGKKKHFYLNLDTGLWDCKRCGEGGNLWTLADHFGVRVREPSLVKSASSVLMAGFQSQATERSRKRKIRDAKGFDLDKAEAASDRLFADGDAEGAAVLEYLRGRGFSDAAIRRFRLGVAWIRTDGDPPEVAVAIPYLEAGRVPLVKMRNLVGGKGTEGRKRKFSRTKGSYSALFNSDHVRDSRSVVLVEAELDAISLWQLGVTSVAATSLGAKKNLPREWVDALANAEDIVLWYDDDEAGEEAVDGLIEQLGSHRCRIASFEDVPELERYGGMLKDANDLLALVDCGESEEDVRAWAKSVVDLAKGLENTSVQKPSAFADHVAAEIQKGEESLGHATGWLALDKFLRGWRVPELTVVTGHTGHGKSTWTLAVAQHLARAGEPVLTSGFENGPSSVARKLFQSKYGRPVSSIRTDEDRDRAFEVLERLDEDPIYVLDLYGQQELAIILDAMRFARSRLGVRFVFLDHLHFFLKRPPGVDEREYIDSVLMDLVKATRELDVHVFLVGHPRGSVEQTTIPTGDSMKGSSSIKQIADNGISVYRPVDMMGDATPRRLKLRDAQGKRVEVELSPLNSLIYVWKARHDDAREGSVILDFNARNLRFTEPKSPVSEDPRLPVDDDDDDEDLFGDDLFPI